MTVAAQGGLIGFGLQADKIGREGTFSPANVDFYKVRAPRVNLGAQQSVVPLDPEVGGALTPTGVYKDQVFFAGDIDILPRLKTAGLLFAGAFGKVKTTADEDLDGPNVGVNKHVFTFDPLEPASQPWMSFRRMIPGATAAENNGETGFDCKINMLRITIPGRGKVAMRVGVQGRDFLLDDASDWTWANDAYEEAGLIPESGRGHFKIGGVEYPILSLQLDIANGLTSPNDEMILGDFRPDDFIALQRAATIRAVYKYQNDDLYRRILTGDADGTEWDSLPFSTKGVDAMEGFFEAPVNIPNATEAVKYAFRFTAGEVAWQVEGPPMLAGGGTIVLNLLGTVIQPEEGDYLTLALINEEDEAYYKPKA